jgi:prolyl oligopeptidase
MTVTKTIGGVTFADPYAWLRDETPDALEWQRQRSAEAVAAAHSVEFHDALAARIRGQIADATASFGAGVKAGGRWFALGVNDAGTAQAIRVSDEPGGPSRCVIDAAALSGERAGGQPVALLHASPSPDGELFAFLVGVGGLMVGEVWVAETTTGRLLDVTAPALLFNLPLPGWLPDGSGFFLQERAPDGRHQLRFVPVAAGTPARETVTFATDDIPPTLPGLVPQVSPTGRWVVGVTVPHEHVAAVIGDLETGTWRRFLPDGFDGECYGDWLDDDTYLAIVTGDDCARGRIVAIDPATSTDPSAWREIVATSDAVLKSIVVLGDRIAVAELVDVALRIRLFGRDGTSHGEVPLPPHSASPTFTAPPRLQTRSDELVFTLTGFTRPPALVRLDPRAGRIEPLGEQRPELNGLDVTQRFATSADGTTVPYWIVHRADVDRSRVQPALVYAYGGFNAALAPAFLGHLEPFVASGGIYVHACLRGGSEYGRAWYEDGRRRRKQHTFDDLRAVAGDLIASGISAPELMAFNGASNGGLLAGVAIVQQPELWRVVAPFVPLFDMLEPLGDVPGVEAVRSYYLEDYGDPDDVDDAAVLASYSPYHNIVDGTPYPAVFSVFGEHDVGCPPFHGRLFTARLRDATSSGHPVHMRVWEAVGHGSASPDVGARQHAEWLAFVMDQLGMTLA